jgi:hypothetical protein
MRHRRYGNAARDLLMVARVIARRVARGSLPFRPRTRELTEFERHRCAGNCQHQHERQRPSDHRLSIFAWARFYVRPSLRVLAGVRIELALAPLRAEVICLPVVLAAAGSLCRIDLHAAHDILFHHRLPSGARLRNGERASQWSIFHNDGDAPRALRRPNATVIMKWATKSV